MDPAATNDFFIWGLDHAVYGPVELPTVVAWIKDERVLADTWLFVRRENTWRSAADVPELQMFFRPKAGAATPGPARLASNDLKPGVLRRVKILARLSD